MATIELSPQKFMFNMISGCWLSQCVCAAAEMGIADLLADGPKTVEELAELAGCQASPLGRLLAALGSAGVFRKDSSDRYELTQYGNFIRSDVPGSLKDVAVMIGTSRECTHSASVMQSLKGEHDYPVTPASGRHVRRFPSSSTLFNEAFAQLPPLAFKTPDHYSPKTPTHQEAGNFELPRSISQISASQQQDAAVLAAYDFSSVTCVADIGGGQGQFLSTILQRNPHIEGILFDLPYVVELVRTAQANRSSLCNRCLLVGGNFFESIPSGADVYILKNILRDWEDLAAARILKACYKNFPSKSRLLIVEELLPTGFNPSVHEKSPTLLRMKSAVGANNDRTESQLASLLADSGFQLRRTMPTACHMSILEATKVPK